LGGSTGQASSGQDGSASNGGAVGSDATSAAGGTVAFGGIGSGGSTGSGGNTGSGGAPAITKPCDIYQASNTPCVAAHSTVRALYGAYSGSLYQVRKADGTTKDIPVDGPGGFVDLSVQDAFCSGTTCNISILYDQSPNHNDLTKSPIVMWLPNGGSEANAAEAGITVSGHRAHGIYVNNPSANVAYRNNTAKGLATGDEPEAMYMVLDGKRYSTICCFDYGNSSTSGLDDGVGTIEALSWGAETNFQRGGAGRGPWVAADLENGMFECDDPQVVCTTNTSITAWAFVTGMLKGPSGNRFVLKAGDAQSGALETKWDGARPKGYTPMKKEGGIILGTSGDGSNYGVGTFFEGCITFGLPSNAADDAIQANVVAASYGR